MVTTRIIENLLSEVVKDIFKKRQRHPRIPSENFQPPAETPPFENSILTIRFSEIIKDQLNFHSEEEISFLLKLKYKSQLDDLIQGKREIPSEFATFLFEQFEVNPDWFLSGKGHAYTLGRPTLKAMDYFEYIKEKSPKSIYFVRVNNNFGQVGIVLKLSNDRYLPLKTTYHISEEVGVTDMTQLTSFYELILKLDKPNAYNGRLAGRILKQSTFSAIFNGYQSARILDSNGMRNSYWWDDFLDYHGEFDIAPNYESWYGKSFVGAQERLKYHLATSR